MLRIVSFFVAVTMCVGAAFAADDAGIKVKWGYTGNTGPSRWGQLDTEFAVCSTGKTQSPINITKKVTKADDQSLKVEYQPAEMNIVDDGQTDITLGKKQILFLDGHGVQLNFPSSGVAENIILNGERYRLIQFHFHSPSENTLRGQGFPMEIHFVHQGENGHVAVIGVFVKGGNENPDIQKIIDNLPEDEGKEHIVKNEQISPAGLLPDKRGYYYFAGSLTTPPCSEGLNWVVMENPITASPSQIAMLRKAAGGANARPVQSLNGRAIGYVKA